MKIPVFWDTISCSFVYRCQPTRLHITEKGCLHKHQCQTLWFFKLHCSPACFN